MARNGEFSFHPLLASVDMWVTRWPCYLLNDFNLWIVSNIENKSIKISSHQCDFRINFVCLSFNALNNPLSQNWNQEKSSPTRHPKWKNLISNMSWMIDWFLGYKPKQMKIKFYDLILFIPRTRFNKWFFKIWSQEYVCRREVTKRFHISLYISMGKRKRERVFIRFYV